MAFTFVAERGTANNKASGNQLQVNPTGTIPAGSLLIVLFVTDNVATASGPGTNHTTVTDTTGSNTYTKVYEINRSSGVALDGVTTSMWYCNVATAITTLDSLSLNLFASTTAKAVFLTEFSMAAGSVAALAGSGTNAATGVGTTNPSMVVSGLSSATRLWYGVLGREGPDGDAYTQDTQFTDRTKFGTTGSTATGNVSAVHGHRIVANTGETYDPDIGTSRDWAGIVTAFDEVAGPQTFNAGVASASATALAATLQAPGVFSAGVATATAGGLAATLTGDQSYADLINADTPVAYWRLGETASTYADTAAGGTAANDLTVQGSGTTRGVTGALASGDDGAVTLNGSGYLDTPDHADLDVGDTLSYEAWVKKAANGTIMVFFSKGATSVELRFHSDNKLFLVTENVAGVVQSTNAITDTNWHHVVATKTGAACKLYVDGVDVTGTITNSTGLNTSVALAVGRRQAGPDSYFNGSLDEVAIYNYVLSPAQVLSHYNKGAGVAPTVHQRAAGADISTVTATAARVDTAKRTGAATIASVSTFTFRNLSTFKRTGAATIASLTATVAVLKSLQRPVAVTIVTVTATVAALKALQKAVAATVTPVTATVARAGTFKRTGTATIATVTATVARLATFKKTGAADVTGITATVARAVVSIVQRAAAADVTGITATASRVAGLARTVAALVPLGEKVAEVDEPNGLTITRSRTVAVTIPSLTATVSRVGTFRRLAEAHVTGYVDILNRAVIRLIERAVAAAPGAGFMSWVARTRFSTYTRGAAATVPSAAATLAKTQQLVRPVAAGPATVTVVLVKVLTNRRPVLVTITGITVVVVRNVTVAGVTWTVFGVLTDKFDGRIPEGWGAYLQGTMMTNDAGTPVRIRLYNVTDGLMVSGSEVTTTATTPTYVRSGSLTFPLAEKEYRVEFSDVAVAVHTVYAAKVVAIPD